MPADASGLAIQTGSASSLSYGAMRLRWCGWALLASARRWGVYVVVTAAVVGAGSNSPVQAVAAVAAWLVLPLFWAAGQGAWLLPAWAAQVLLGLALLWGARALLWPPQWAEAERALPLRRSDTQASDALVVSLALAPLGLLYAMGASVLLSRHAPWLQPHRGLALMALLSATLATAVSGVLLLQRQRLWQPGRQRRLPAAASSATLPGPAGAVPAAMARLSAMSWPKPLLWWPLWRGPARRTGRTLWLSTIGLFVPAAGLVWRSELAPWWLAAFAAASLMAVSRLATLARLELAPLHAAAQVLPLSPLALRQARWGLVCLPLWLGLVALCVALAGAAAAGPVQVNRAVFSAYVLVCLLAGLVEAMAEPADAAAQSSRWLLSLCLGIALASEATG